MADEIMEELWKIKDALNEKHEGDLQAYCDYLNRTVVVEGFELVNRSRPAEAKVAEEPPEYGSGKGSG